MHANFWCVCEPANLMQFVEAIENFTADGFS